MVAKTRLDKLKKGDFLTDRCIISFPAEMELNESVRGSKIK